MVVEKTGDAEKITLKVELMKDSADRRQSIESELTDQLRLKTNLRYDLKFYDYETLPRYEVKAKRFKDMRKK